MYDSGWGGHSFFGMGLGGGLIMLLFWLVVVVAIVALVRWLSGTQTSSGHRGDKTQALEILEERYARGEIDDEEYQKKRRNLS